MGNIASRNPRYRVWATGCDLEPGVGDEECFSASLGRSKLEEPAALR